ncbi:hypothetical protein Agub_g4316 [Astrephomene gubernaculifera]|uniref:glutamate formimidoyltransferase n=1 Tax=Astrephomene gubernaculifera TaxID=47775 RepID=A0AAD3DK04_9CHLO|nr:hypothetical protein Agub_g4316 [Astrephomene gubernaculifera]
MYGGFERWLWTLHARLQNWGHRSVSTNDIMLCSRVARLARFVTKDFRLLARASPDAITRMRAREIHCAIGCNVYISEGRNRPLIVSLQAEAETTPGVVLAHTFVDEPYNRTGFTFVSHNPDQLAAAVVRLSHSALLQLDLRTHAASHPRLGAVDHISLHPLQLGSHHGCAPGNSSRSRSRSGSSSGRDGSASSGHGSSRFAADAATAVPAPGGGHDGPAGNTAGGDAEQAGCMAVAAACAQDIARQLAEGPGGGVPVYLYGHAHTGRRTLAEVRRQLGYFQRSQAGNWQGALSTLPRAHPHPHPQHQEQQPGPNQEQTRSQDQGQEQRQVPAAAQALPLLSCPPDLGPAAAPPRSGVVTIGAVPWVVNYNVPLVGVEPGQARQLARALSERGGGLPHVQAMALLHADGCVEVACNLLDAAVTPPEVLQRRLAELAAAAGLPAAAVRRGYCTNKSPEELLRIAAEAAAAAEGAI